MHKLHLNNKIDNKRMHYFIHTNLHKTQTTTRSSQMRAEEKEKPDNAIVDYIWYYNYFLNYTSQNKAVNTKCVGLFQSYTKKHFVSKISQKVAAT